MSAKTILLVEDEVTLLCGALRQEGYAVLAARCREEALALISGRLNQVDLVVVDLHFGNGKDGAWLAQEVRKRAEIPVVFLYSLQTADCISAMEDSSCYGIVDRNSDPALIVALIRMAFRRNQSSQENQRKNESLGMALEAGSAGAWDWDIVQNLFHWSPEFLKLFGMGPETVPSFEAWEKAVHPEDRETARRNIQEAMAEPKELINEYRILLPDGRIRWILATGKTIYEGANPVRMIGICMDISKQKSTEQELHESQEHYRRITEAITDYVYTVKVKIGHAAETSHGPGCWAVTGYRELDFTLDPYLWLHMVVPEDRRKVEEQAARILANEDPPPIEHRIRHRNGSIRSVRNTCVPHRDENGVLLSYDGLIQDITEKKQAEETLKETLELLDTVFENSPIGIEIYDKNAVMIRANRKVEEMFQVDVRQYLGKFCLRTDPNYQVPGVWERLARGEIVEHEIEFDASLAPYVTTRKGKSHLAVITTPIPDEVSRRVGYIMQITDITGRKRAEEEQEKLQSQLIQAQKMESIGRLAGGVAHDFNNMLGVILGHAEMALDQVGPEQSIFADLLEIRKTAQHSADLTRQLLAFARKQTAMPKVLDLNETLEGMLKMLRRLIGEEIELVWLPGRGLKPIRMDPSQIDQILANLCINARDAIRGVGTVTIETQYQAIDPAYGGTHKDVTPGEYAVLHVRDDGSGMEAAVLERIFEPFFTTKALGKGTGLGLATVYGIVKQNNGHIQVSSEPGRGTTFQILLPAYPGKPESRQMESAPEPARLGTETVLLVEDDLSLLKMTKGMLERLGYKVLACGSPAAAIQLVQKKTDEIHLALTDIIMPEMNGIELARQLLALSPNLRFLFTSGYTADAIEDRGILQEGMLFIEKPFTVKDLAVKVREALGRP